jgi:hypothetical protein
MALRATSASVVNLDACSSSFWPMASSSLFTAARSALTAGSCSVSSALRTRSCASRTACAWFAMSRSCEKSETAVTAPFRKSATPVSSARRTSVRTVPHAFPVFSISTFS